MCSGSSGGDGGGCFSISILMTHNMHVLTPVLSGEPPKVRSQPELPSPRILSFQRHLLYFHVSEKEKCFPEDNREGVLLGGTWILKI